MFDIYGCSVAFVIIVVNLVLVFRLEYFLRLRSSLKMQGKVETIDFPRCLMVFSFVVGLSGVLVAFFMPMNLPFLVALDLRVLVAVPSVYCLIQGYRVFRRGVSK